ncbi:MAG: RdgB/HAM1 family non-canonical purine NTP pyrophosphatase [Verrucomicrobia bacterium]|nr:RdgB/HAM1 family non-canonical purine NTP pyrophosphatase [Verrucomicrobiota bacterium]MBV8378031.1 RdgB/HAM1 family non-canonical purine NTP pyrophosphatase [Verrucomicrobiota bacterium]
MQTLLIATWNRHKTREIGQMLGAGWDVRDLASLPHAPKVEETGATFEENATLKALTISRIFTGLVLADDSGLEVDALSGAPGVHSARFAGPNASDAENRFLLIGKLRSFGGNEFPARFRCVMVLASRGELLGSFTGIIHGSIILEERGESGFGYDSVFVPAGYAETFGELQSEIKNSLSHRGRALAKVVEFFRS